MININDLSNKIRHYIDIQINNMASSTPAIAFFKPLLTRAIDKKFSKVYDALEAISDKDGNIDIENIIDEMTSNMLNMNPFTIETSIIGNVELGGSAIKFDIPYINKHLVISKQDLDYFKQTLKS